MRTAWTTYLRRSDAAVLAGAIAGALVYLLLLPDVHPMAAVRYSLGEEEAVAIAERFLVEQGYAVEGLHARAALHQNPNGLLDSLQHDLGRATVIQHLTAGEARGLPAFFWQVRFYGEERILFETNEEESRYAVRLTQDGVPWHVEVRAASRPAAERRTEALARIDRSALQTVWASASPAPLDTTLAAVPDTLLAELLLFVLDSAGPISIGRDSPEGVSYAARPLNAADAEQLARHHLGRFYPIDAGFVVDSMWTGSGQREQVAVVRFRSAEPVLGQRVRVDVGVASVGALQSMQTRFNPRLEAADTSATLAIEIARGMSYVVLVVGLFIAFFRRLTRRLIDARAALVDAAVITLLVVSSLVLNVGVALVDVETTSDAMVVLGGLLVLALIGGVVMLFVFLLSSAADSVARTVWPEKLLTASMVRTGVFRSPHVGAALVRGVLFGFVVLGAATLLLAVLPGVPLHTGTSELLPHEWLRPMPALAAVHGAEVYLKLLMLLLGAAPFLYHTTKRTSVTVAVVAVLAGALQVSPAVLGVEALDWLASSLVGAGLVWIFWRYDFLTAVTTLLVATLVWSVSEGWLAQASPALVDAWLAFVFVGGVALLGTVGLVWARPGTERSTYTPAYFRELRQQERLQRELEIAHQVQDSFLPRRVPQVDGLDIAAMCLAANEVGGDYFDYVPLGPDRLGIAIGDVSGKGIQAAFYMTLVKGFLQTLSRDIASPAEVLRRLNDLFCENAPRGMFVSMIYGVIDLEESTFTFARAGHNPLIVSRMGQAPAEMLQPPGMAIGLTADGIFASTIREETVAFRTSDVFVLYTDGFSEAVNRAREQYGDERIAQRVGEVRQRSAAEVLRGVTEDVHHFVEQAGRHDDMTMMVLKVTARARSGRLLEQQAGPEA